MNLNRLLKSKKNTVSVLVDGGQWIGKEYKPGTRYTGFITINNAAMFPLEPMPETVYVEGRETQSEQAFFDIAALGLYRRVVQETDFTAAHRFPYDIPSDYEKRNKMSFYAAEDTNNEIIINAYNTQYIKPFTKTEKTCFGRDIGHKIRILYALDDNRNIEAIIMPIDLGVCQGPLITFAKDSVYKWFAGGLDAIEGFAENLQEVISRARV